jgi:hypothetical protein
MIDPKPLRDFRSLPCIAELEVFQNGRGVPLAVYPPAICSSFGNHLRVVVMDMPSHTAQYITLDTAGQMVGLAKDLPLSFVAGAVPCAGELVLSGTRLGDDRPVVFGLSEEGAIRWSVEIPITGELSRWPRPLCVEESIWLAWETGTLTSTLWVSEVHMGACTPPEALTFDDTTVELDMLAVGRGLTFARTHGNPVQLELLRIVDGQLVRRESVPGAAQVLTPTIAAVADRYVVLWISGSDRSIDVQWFDWNFAPIVPASNVLTLSPGPVRFRSAQLFQGNAGYLAISYQTVTTGDGSIQHRSDGITAIREPSRIIEQFVAAYEWKSQKFGSFQRVVPPGISYNTGCWLVENLFLLHGEGDLIISVYQGQKTA